MSDYAFGESDLRRLTEHECARGRLGSRVPVAFGLFGHAVVAHPDTGIGAR